MKLNIRDAARWVLPSLGLTLLLAGCEEKKPSAMEASAVSTNATVRDADNSGRNVRDRNDAMLTPGDQGTSPGEIETTRKVRQALVSGTNNFSVVARNIKIITANGKVTLRGPVKSEAEKADIVAIAKSVASDSAIDDQLEVKANQ